MTIHRRVCPSIHDSQDFLSLSGPKPNAQSLFLYLLTSYEMTPIPGVVLANSLLIAARLGVRGWSVKDVERCLAEIIDRGMAEADEGSRLIWLPAAIRQDQNKPGNPNQIRGWGTFWRMIPRCELRSKVFHALRAWIATDFPPSFLAAFDERLRNTESQRYGGGGGEPFPNIGSGSGSGSGYYSSEPVGAFESPLDSKPLTLIPPPDPNAPPPDTVITFPTTGKEKRWHLRSELLAELSKAYPAVNAELTARQALAWCQTNAAKRKTARGMPAFLNAWFARSQNAPQAFPNGIEIHRGSRATAPPSSRKVEMDAGTAWHKAERERIQRIRDEDARIEQEAKKP